MPYGSTEAAAQHIKDDPVFWGLLLLLVWAPLPLGSNRFWAAGLLLVMVLLLLLGSFLSWWRHPVLAWQRIKTFSWPLGLMGLMVMVSWLQTLPLPSAWVGFLSPMAAATQSPAKLMTLSLDVYQSRFMATLSFVYFGVFLVAVLTVQSHRRLDKLAQTLVWSGVLQAVFAAVMWSVHAKYQVFYVAISHNDAIGTFVNRNHLAGYLCMCLSVGIGLMLAKLGRVRRSPPNWRARLVNALEFILSAKMRLRLLLIVMVIALVLTRSRMGNSAFFSAMLVVGALAVVLARKTAPHTIVLIASLVVIDIFVVGTWVGLEKVVERVQGTTLMTVEGGVSESIEARSEAARTALAIIQDYPLFGTGGGSFYNIFLSYRTPDYGYNYVDHAHNDYVEIATDFGLLGLGILGLLVVLSLWTVVKVMATRRSPLPWGIAFGVTMSMVAMLIHSTVDFNLQIPSNALTMVVILSMGWVAKTLPRGT